MGKSLKNDSYSGKQLTFFYPLWYSEYIELFYKIMLES